VVALDRLLESALRCSVFLMGYICVSVFIAHRHLNLRCGAVQSALSCAVMQ